MILLIDAFQLFIPCLLGTILIIECEKFYDEICNVSWYLLAESEKKSMALIMLSAMTPRSMACGLQVIDLQMFVEVKIDLLSLLKNLKVFFSTDLQEDLLVFDDPFEHAISSHTL